MPVVETVRRWANPKCRRPGQPLLRTVRLGGELLTLPAGVRDFERERIRAGLPAGITEPMLQLTCVPCSKCVKLPCCHRQQAAFSLKEVLCDRTEFATGGVC